MRDLEHALGDVIDERKRKFANGAMIWVHPDLSLMQHGILDMSVGRYMDIPLKCVANGVYVERNLRYDLIPGTLASRLPAEGVVIGAYAHDIVDIDSWAARMTVRTST